MEKTETQIVDINSLQPSKSTLPIVAQRITSLVDEGWEDAVSLSAKLNFMGKVCEEAQKIIKDKVIDEIQKGTTFSNGYKTEVTEAGVKYDYSNCNDDEYAALEEELKVLKGKMEAREKFLKSLPQSGFHFVDPETGEEKKIYPPAKKSTTSPKFTLQK